MGEQGASKRGNAGNVLFYIFLAVGLIGALTYAFVKDSRENYAAQNAVQIAEALFVQTNMIRGAVQQCIMEYPEGGDGTCGGFSCADLNQDGTITSADNPNLPYPLNPTSALNPNAKAGLAAAAADNVRNLSCVGAPASAALMFSGASNQGRFLPPPPTGFSEWSYANNTNGVYIQITAPADAASLDALRRMRNKFNTCQAEINYASCGTNCFTAWLLRITAAACL